MTSIFQDGALHPGRDANDAWWIVVRRPEDWGTDPRPPGDYGTRYDPSRMVLELAPHALAPGTAGPPDVVASDGTLYIVDTVNDRILRKRPCDPAPVPLIGAHGAWTGYFDRPYAIALDDRGWLYVADRGNNRVQVIDPDEPRVVIVLDVDDPVAVAVGRSRVYVATGDGHIQPFDRQFRRGAAFAANRPGAGAPSIIGLATDGDELVVVADAGWSRLSRFDCHGSFVDEIGADRAPASLADEMRWARFELEGTRVVGPIDGGIDRLAWHQIVVDAELPPGTSIEVQTWAADAVEQPPPLPAILPVLPTSPPWAPVEPVGIPLAGESSNGETARPVLSDTTAWELWRNAPYLRGAAWKHDLGGTGPNASSVFTVPFEIARNLRSGDEIELRTAVAITRNISVIANRDVAVIASGDRAPAYGSGTEIVLHERDGHGADPAVIHTLAVGESIDLSAVTVDGGGADITMPHAVAALLARGDVVELRNGPRSAHVVIEDITLAAASITLTSAVAGDLRTAVLRLVEPAGRIVVRSAEGWGRGLAAGSTIELSRIGAGGAIFTDPRTVRWSDARTATVWLSAAPDPAWISFSPAAPASATDRGRYLWIKLRLRGARRNGSDFAATQTPVVRSLRLVAPRLSYLAYLPAVYSRRDDFDPTGALFLERFLALFERRLTTIEHRYEAIAYLLNPLAADDEWLDFVASWFELVLDPAWPRQRRARLLTEIFELYRIRGTPEGIARIVEAYTGHRPQLIEGFQIRPRAGLVLGCEGMLGCAPLGGLDTESAAGETLLAAYAHRFTLVTYIDDDCDLFAATSGLRALVDAIKPAHVEVDLRIAVPRGRIGLESTIGVDFILGDDRRRESPLGTASALGVSSPVLGVDAVLKPSLGESALAESAPPSIGAFTIR